MSKFYYHGVGNIMCSSLVIDKMITILNTGGLKSKKFLNINIHGGYNGDDYVSICKKESKELYDKYPFNAFYTYIQNSSCFIISDKVNAIKTKYYDSIKNGFSYYELSELVVKNPNIRYSDMFDEYQVYEEIPMDYFLGIGLPLDYKDYNLIDNKIYTLCDLAYSLGLDIVDTRDDLFVEEYEKTKLLALK